MRAVVPVSAAVNKLVWVKAGGLCAFPDCRKPLVEAATYADDEALLGQVAHIVGHSEERGPRSEHPIPGGDRNGVGNFLLLCPIHHKIVDTQVATYTVERLVGMREDHERWVREQLSINDADANAGPLKAETVHSSLLAVDRMPARVYTAPCGLLEKDVRSRIRITPDSPVALPFIVRAGLLISFARLTDADNPFADAISEPGAAERHDAKDWWQDKDLSSWYVTLLNRTLNKLTGRRGLNLDKEHQRYYFEPNKDEEGRARPRTVLYQPLNRAASEKSVVWKPKKRRTGEARNYWIHFAVALRFHRVSATHWVLSVRPERRYTIDGLQPLVPKATGKRSTSLKSHMYNYVLLGELQFWKEYLSKGEPHIILDFGGQSLVIDAMLLPGEAEWPGIPGDVKPFENVVRPDDLFSSVAYHRALEGSPDPDAELELWELEDIVALETADDAVGDTP